MNKTSRRDFLRTYTVMGLALSTGALRFEKRKPLLSFSTLGCPDWSFTEILDFAAKHHYDGIEMRGIKRELDLTKCPEFSSPQRIKKTLKMVKDKGLRFVDLGSSAEMHHTDAKQREKNLDEAKRFIDLAQKLNCPYIRVFPNNLPNNEKRNEVIELIEKGLLELSNYAQNSNVTVLMETHGDVLRTDELIRIMEATKSTHVGLVWDIINMWSVTKEPPAAVYNQLKKYIKHVHIKDLKLIDNKEKYVLLGKGDSPIFEAIDALYNGGYKGFYSFEWEKLWHPEIDNPEIALADYPVAMRAHFKIINN